MSEGVGVFLVFWAGVVVFGVSGMKAAVGFGVSVMEALLGCCCCCLGSVAIGTGAFVVATGTAVVLGTLLGNLLLAFADEELRQ